MTKAKRYEGESLRAVRWHELMRSLAWSLIKRTEEEKVLTSIWSDYHECGYVIQHCYEYNAEVVNYDIVTRLFVGEDNGSMQTYSGEAVFKHVEPYYQFPSEHLKAKLLLIAS